MSDSKKAAATRLGAWLLALGVGCAPAPAPPGSTSPGGWPLAGRAASVVTSGGVVVSGHPLASEVGAGVLEAGGNAADAAVAVAFALAVVHPEAGNLGGGGFALHRSAGGELRALDFRERAPAGATRDMFLDALGETGDRSLVGHLAVGVPGSVAGLAELHRQLGSRPWAELLAPSIELARSHRMDDYRSRSLAENAERLLRFPASAAQFLPGGRPPAPGEAWSQPDLASTLERISEQGADAFYRGPIAALLVEEMERGGGLVTLRDLADYRPVWREPVFADYRGHRVCSVPPPSSGGVTLGMLLHALGGFDRLPAFGSAKLVHLEAETMRRVFLDRNRLLGDPAFVTAPLARLLSEERAARVRTGIDPRRATATVTLTDAPREGADTTHFSIVDAAGDAVALTTTINSLFGSGVTVTGAGFLLNNEMDDFATAPGRPNQYGLVEGEANAIAPGKRMLSSMTPTIVEDPQGNLFLVAGSPGGPRIITSVYHLISNLIDHGMDLAEAVESPRVHHQALPDEIAYEPGGLAPETIAALEAMGHRLAERDEWSGDVNAILIRPGGRRAAVADPRRGGAPAAARGDAPAGAGKLPPERAARDRGAAGDEGGRS